MADSVSTNGEIPSLARARRRERKTAPVDRLPPNNTEAEQSVLGCILLAPNESMPLCIEKFPQGGSVFYDLKHTAVYNSCVSMYDQRIPIDLITLQAELIKEDMLEACGGIIYLSQLQETPPSAANVEYYIAIVEEKFLLRTMIQTGAEMSGRAYEGTEPFEDIVAKADEMMSALAQAKSVTGLMPIKEAVQKAAGRIEDYVNNQGKITGIATGFTDLDRMTYGLQNSEMIIIAARPSLGKTSIAMNIADFVAVQNKIPVGVFSLEMSTESLVMRMICSRARVNLRNVRDGFMAERDFPKLTGAMGAISKAPLYIDDTPGLSLIRLRTKMRRMVQQYGIKLFIIDYLQLLQNRQSRKDGRQQEVSDITAGLKGICKELNMPVLVLAQLNRDIEKEKNRKPRMSDLRESGSIEQDADLLGFLYRPSVNDDDDDTPSQDNAEAIPVNLLIAKQRNGPTGEVPLTFIKSYTRFESAARVSYDDEPQPYRAPYPEQTEFTEPEPA